MAQPGKLHFAFNGDADGLCALQQLRLEDPSEAQLVTGTKREINLVGRVVAAPGDRVIVLDVSLAVNHAAVRALLESGVQVHYFDHHDAGEPLAHPGLERHIDTSPVLCTSLLVNAHLKGRQRRWAAVGAWGDNLDDSADAALAGDALDAQARATLRRLGTCLNYNAYGDTLDDLLIAPAELHRRLLPHADPLDFCRSDPLFGQLGAQMDADMAAADGTPPIAESAAGAVYLLADAAWSRRVSGLWAHALASRDPQRASAVLTVKPGGGFVVSVRAPLARPRGASALCRRFPTGGGREGAAGINRLPADHVQAFCHAFLEHFKPGHPPPA